MERQGLEAGSKRCQGERRFRRNKKWQNSLQWHGNSEAWWNYSSKGVNTLNVAIILSLMHRWKWDKLHTFLRVVMNEQWMANVSSRVPIEKLLFEVFVLCVVCLYFYQLYFLTKPVLLLQLGFVCPCMLEVRCRWHTKNKRISWFNQQLLIFFFCI